MPSPTRRRSSRPPARRRSRSCSCTSTTPSAPSMQQGIGAVLPKFNMPYKIVENDRLRSDRARSLGRSGQGQGDRRRGAAGGQPPQRRHPDHPRAGQAALDADGACSAWARAGTRISISRRSASCRDGPISFVPWYDPNKKLSQAARGRARQGAIPASTSTPTTSTRSRRCWSPPTPTSVPRSTDPKALADAIRTTNITDNVSIGPGIQFDAKGQNDKLQELRDPEPRRQAGDGGAEGRGQRQGRMADDALRQAQLSCAST